MSGSYAIHCSTDRFSQVLNVKNSLSSLEGCVLQDIQCTIAAKQAPLFSVSTKAVSL